jgi:hypothetical protein
MLVVAALGTGYAARRWYRHHAHHWVALAAPRPGPTWTPPALTIPIGHPRLWWTPERLARGRAWAKRTAFHPRQDEPSELALAYVLEGDRAAGRKAVDWLLRLTLETSGVASDQARWNGEDAMLVFDWCHDLLNVAERQILVSRWNSTLDALNRKPWGGAGMEGNNYFWGYLRDDVEWAIASAHENPAAPDLSRYALGTRFGHQFVPWAEGPGRGGVLPEGSQYGPYLVDYATIPLVATADMGVDAWDATSFFKEAIYYLVYATTPAPTTTAHGGERRFELFPFDDDEKFLEEGGSAEKPELAAFVIAASEQWRGAPVGQYARAWLDLVAPKLSPLSAASAGGPPVKSRPFTDLPLDDYAPGAGMLYARNVWGPAASVVNLQLGRPEGVGHQHVDWGTFQIWRGGRWLTRETVGYGDAIADWGGSRLEGVPTTKDGTVASDGALGHNTVLFEGEGARTADNRRAPPHLLRVASRPAFAYAAVDLTDSYRCSPDECRPERDENFYAGSVVREFIYLRALEALVIFDRMEASDDRAPAAEVVKSFVLHAETKPVADGENRLRIDNGGQTLRLFTLLPARETPRVVSEGGKVGQFRVEIDTTGAPLGYFLNVLQARGGSDPDLSVTLQEGANDFTLRVAHPTHGSAVVVFAKGKSSHGGAVGFAPTGTPVPAPLSEGIQGIAIGDAGPRWQ